MKTIHINLGKTASFHNGERWQMNISTGQEYALIEWRNHETKRKEYKRQKVMDSEKLVVAQSYEPILHWQLTNTSLQ